MTTLDFMEPSRCCSMKETIHTHVSGVMATAPLPPGYQANEMVNRTAAEQARRELGRLVCKHYCRSTVATATVAANRALIFPWPIVRKRSRCVC